MKVCQAVASLNFLDAQLNLLVGLILIGVQVCKIELQDTALQLFRRNLCALRPRHQGLTAIAHAEETWRFNVVPFLLQEWIAGLLLATLLSSFGEAFVLANSHFYYMWLLL